MASEATVAPPPPIGRSLLSDRWPRFASRHPWGVIAGALAFVLICGVLFATVRGEFGGGFSLPGPSRRNSPISSAIASPPLQAIARTSSFVRPRALSRRAFGLRLMRFSLKSPSFPR